MNMGREQYQPGSAAAVVGDGDNNDNDNIANIEEQPHDNDTGSDTDNGDGDGNDVDDDDDDDDDDNGGDNGGDDKEENASDIDIDNDAAADAAVHQLLRALFDWMQKGTSHVKRLAASAGKVGAILLQRKDFPYRQRKKICALVTDFFCHLERNKEMLADFQEQHPDNGFDTMDEPIKIFLKDLGRDISDMLFDQSYDEDEYRGLDSSRDTEEEVITAIRLFPETLTHTGGHWGEYPIVCIQELSDESEILSNTRAVFFVHVLAKLAIEYNSFGENLRGGLLVDDDHESSKILNLLVRSQSGGDDDYHRNADNVFLEELIRLYHMDLFKKEDVQRYDLVKETIVRRSKYFEERRFQFLVQLDPYSLLHNTRDRCLPLYVAATNYFEPMQRFRSVFDAVMRYFPYQNGIASLFRKNDIGTTPYQDACGDKNKRRQEVMDIVEATVARYSETTPINTENALILAATDATIHLDCVFFLLKRQPDVLLSLLLRQPPQNTTDSTTNNSKRSRSSTPHNSKRNRN